MQKIIGSVLLLISSQVMAAVEWPRENKYFFCLATYTAYFDGCTQEYYNKKLTNEQIDSVVKSCDFKAKQFTKHITLCENVQFENLRTSLAKPVLHK